MKSLILAIQMGTIVPQYFPVVLAEQLRWLKRLSVCMKSWSVTIQMKATEQYFPVVLFIILYMVLLASIMKCDH